MTTGARCPSSAPGVCSSSRPRVEQLLLGALQPLPRRAGAALLVAGQPHVGGETAAHAGAQLVVQHRQVDRLAGALAADHADQRAAAGAKAADSGLWQTGQARTPVGPPQCGQGALRWRPAQAAARGGEGREARRPHVGQLGAGLVDAAHAAHAAGHAETRGTGRPAGAGRCAGSSRGRRWWPSQGTFSWSTGGSTSTAPAGSARKQRSQYGPAQRRHVGLQPYRGPGFDADRGPQQLDAGSGRAGHQRPGRRDDHDRHVGHRFGAGQRDRGPHAAGQPVPAPAQLVADPRWPALDRDRHRGRPPLVAARGQQHGSARGCRSPRAARAAGSRPPPGTGSR